MKGTLNCTCNEEILFSSCSISEDGKKIIADSTSKTTAYCPFDKATSLVVDYLNIGYLYSKGYNTADDILKFVTLYGMPDRENHSLDITEFSENAEALYMHFREISQNPYPEFPEWVMETEPVAALVSKNTAAPYILWQTANLSNAIELAYSLLLCADVKQLGLCKHCGKPFYSKNPKSEFCSPACRNKFNVYKSRNKNKN